MTVHMVGSGIASLAAAAYMILYKVAAPDDVIIYEATGDVGGAMAMSTVRGASRGRKRPKNAYVMPAARVLESEYRCFFDFFSNFDCKDGTGRTISEQIIEFNTQNPYHDTSRLVDGNRKIIPSTPRLGITDEDCANALLFLAIPEHELDQQTIDDYFTEAFYQSEFFLAWSTLMGPLPEHSAIEFQRYFKRFLHIVPCADTMKDVWRTPMNQYDGLVRPLREWLSARGARLKLNTIVEDVTFAEVQGGIEATSIKLSTTQHPIPMAERDLVFITLGSQLTNLSIGSMNQAPKRVVNPEKAWALWAQIQQNAEKLHRHDFGEPTAFFRPDDPLSTWVTFTVTTTDRTFLDRLSTFTGVPSLNQGLVTLVDSPWRLTVAPFPKPHFRDQPKNIWTWWGFSLCHDRHGHYDRNGAFVQKPILECSGSDILKETIRQFGFQSDEAAILRSSVCIPCLLPHVGSVWQKRRQADRPKVIPHGARNFAFIGQFCEMPDDTMFTMEYSIRSAREAVSRLFKHPVSMPPVYDGLRDPKAIGAVMERFLIDDVIKKSGLSAVAAKICPSS
jgi:oleate hydratase